MAIIKVNDSTCLWLSDNKFSIGVREEEGVWRYTPLMSSEEFVCTLKRLEYILDKRN